MTPDPVVAAEGRKPEQESAFVDEWGHELTDEEVDEFLAAEYPDWEAGSPNGF